MMASQYRIIGVDPGLLNTGYAIIGVTFGLPIALAHGHIKAPAVAKKVAQPLAARLGKISDSLAAAAEAYAPHEAAMERMLFRGRMGKMSGLEACGAIRLTLWRAGVECVADYSPSEIKLDMAGHGHAPKDLVKAAVEARLPHLRDSSLNDHIIDAYGIALTHALRLDLLK